MLWQLYELLASSNSASRTISIIDLKLVDSGKVSSSALLSLSFAVAKHLLPNCSDSLLLSLNALIL